LKYLSKASDRFIINEIGLEPVLHFDKSHLMAEELRTGPVLVDISPPGYFDSHFLASYLPRKVKISMGLESFHINENSSMLIPFRYAKSSTPKLPLLSYLGSCCLWAYSV